MIHESIKIECPKGFRIQCKQVNDRIAELMVVPEDKYIHGNMTSKSSIIIQRGVSIRFARRGRAKNGEVLQPYIYVRVKAGKHGKKLGMVKDGYRMAIAGVILLLCENPLQEGDAIRKKFPALESVNKFGRSLAKHLGVDYEDISK